MNVTDWTILLLDRRGAPVHDFSDLTGDVFVEPTIRRALETMMDRMPGLTLAPWLTDSVMAVVHVSHESAKREGWIALCEDRKAPVIPLLTMKASLEASMFPSDVRYQLRRRSGMVGKAKQAILRADAHWREMVARARSSPGF